MDRTNTENTKGFMAVTRRMEQSIIHDNTNAEITSAFVRQKDEW